MHPPQKRLKSTPLLHEDLQFEIFSFCTLEFVFSVLIHLNSTYRALFHRRILNASFFRTRERRIFVDVVFGRQAATWRDPTNQDVSALEKINRGFPLLYHDLHWMLQKRRDIVFLMHLFPQGVQSFGNRLTVHLGWPFAAFHGFIGSKYKNQTEKLVHVLDCIPLYASDREVMLKLLHMDAGVFSKVSEHLRTDRSFVLEALENPDVLHRLPWQFQSDKEMVLRACQHLPPFRGRIARDFISRFIDDEEFILQVLKYDQHALGKHTIQNMGEDFLRKAMTLSSKVYKHGPLSLKMDKSIIMSALETEFFNITYIPVEALDKDILMESARRGGLISRHLYETYPEGIVSLEELQLAAMKFAPYLFQAIPPYEQTREMVFAAVAHGKAIDLLRDCSEHLRGDREVVLACVKVCPLSLEHASVDVRGDEEVVCAAVSRGGFALRHASPELRKNKCVVLLAVQNEPKCLKFASGALRRDPDVIRAAFRSVSTTFENAPMYAPTTEFVLHGVEPSVEEERNEFGW